MNNIDLKTIGLSVAANAVVTILLFAGYHFFVNKPIITKMTHSSRIVYTVNSKKLLMERENTIKTLVLQGRIDEAEKEKEAYIAYLNNLEKAAKALAKQENITILVSDAVVAGENNVDVTNVIASMAKK